jgi:hypothetical protein
MQAPGLPGGPVMADPNEYDVERRLVASPDPAVRVVLAELDAPGSLHYLLEAEGFHVVGCASDERELGRVLGQDLDPDVIVLDADVTATSVLVAREHAPEAYVIAIWPDDVLPPPGGERVSPRLVYEELGPTIRRQMDKRVVPVPDIILPSAELAAVATGAGGPGSALVRAASRLSVTSVTLITAILLTMGVSFALGGFRASPKEGPPRVLVPGPSTPEGSETSDPITGRAPRSNESGHRTGGGPGDRPAGHHDGARGQNAPVSNTGGEGNTGSDPGTPVDQGGNPVDQGGNPGDQGGNPGDQGGNPGDQGGNPGNQGGGSGDQGGNPGDQGGGSGDQGDQDDQGQDDQGDQGGNQGDQGGGQGDQGSQDQGDQGGNQGDQGGNRGDQRGGQGDYDPARPGSVRS